MHWLVYNGWQGNGRIAVILQADTIGEALETAKRELREYDESLGKYGHGPDYWEHVEAYELELPFVTEIG